MKLSRNLLKNVGGDGDGTMETGGAELTHVCRTLGCFSVSRSSCSTCGRIHRLTLCLFVVVFEHLARCDLRMSVSPQPSTNPPTPTHQHHSGSAFAECVCLPVWMCYDTIFLRNPEVVDHHFPILGPRLPTTKKKKNLLTFLASPFSPRLRRGLLQRLRLPDDITGVSLLQKWLLQHKY